MSDGGVELLHCFFHCVENVPIACFKVFAPLKVDEAEHVP